MIKSVLYSNLLFIVLQTEHDFLILITCLFYWKNKTIETIKWTSVFSIINKIFSTIPLPLSLKKLGTPLYYIHINSYAHCKFIHSHCTFTHIIQALVIVCFAYYAYTGVSPHSRHRRGTRRVNESNVGIRIITKPFLNSRRIASHSSHAYGCSPRDLCHTRTRRRLMQIAQYEQYYLSSTREQIIIVVRRTEIKS